MAELKTTKQLTDHLVHLLAEEGYRPKLNERGDVEFRFQSHTMIVDTYPDDEHYVRIIIPNFWSLDSQDEINRAYRAAAAVNVQCKAVKLSVYRDCNMWVSVEFFISSTDHLTPYVMERSIHSAFSGVGEFRSKMTELRDDPPVASAADQRAVH